MSGGKRQSAGARTDRRAMLLLAASAMAVAAIVLPFLLPYGELRRLGFVPRTLAEVQKYSADVYAWFTADPHLLLWHRVMNAWPHAEGALFPGLTITLLAGLGIVSTVTPVAAGDDSRILRILFIGVRCGIDSAAARFPAPRSAPASGREGRRPRSCARDHHRPCSRVARAVAWSAPRGCGVGAVRRCAVYGNRARRDRDVIRSCRVRTRTHRRGRRTVSHLLRCGARRRRPSRSRALRDGRCVRARRAGRNGPGASRAGAHDARPSVGRGRNRADLR